MLQQKTSLNLSHNSKCGEIYFLANNLSFVCIICELETESYLEFRLHLEKLHLFDLNCETQRKNAEDLGNILEEKVLKSTVDLKTSAENYIDPLNWVCENKQVCEESQKGDTNILSNEFNSLTNSPALKAELNSEKIEKKSKLELESDNSDSCSNTSNFDDNTSSIDFKIDWNIPYTPAQNISKRPYKPRDKPNACRYCGRTFRRRYQLDTHLNIHTGEKPHQCEICGRRFRALTTLQRHLNTHEKRKDYVCQFCDTRFTHRAALLSHESRHVQKRTVSCDECEKKFYTLNHCDTHKRRVHNKSNTTLPILPFACDICSNRYRSASMLSTHKFRKHFKTAKFTCEKCDKRFVDQQNLELHQKIHINKVEEI